MEYFRSYKKEIAVALGTLIGNPVDNTAQGVHDAVACAFEHGSYNDGAKAVLMAAQWMWADCEERYHAAQPAAK